MVERGREEIVLSSGIDVDGMRAEAPGEKGLAALKEQLQVSGKRVVTMISRIDENKGIHEFVEAAELVAGQRDNTAFLLVGPYATEGGGCGTLCRRPPRPVPVGAVPRPQTGCAGSAGRQ